MRQLSFLAALFFCCYYTPLAAQNTLTTLTNPDQLYVCGQDTVTITINNTGAGPLNNLTASVTFPAGIEYVPGTINGATEQNISNLGSPVFSAPTLGVGAAAVIRLQVTATCEVIGAINSGQLFNNQVNITYQGGSDQVNSTSYPVETGLAVIVSATPVSIAGEIGDMINREIVVRNTRLGPIQALTFSDQHFPGYEATAPGSATESNAPVLFNATFDGSFFSNFGDGDAFFEFNEQVTIVQKVTITDCGTPSFDNPSTLRIGWGCAADVCQYDSANLKITILPSTQNPDLRFEPVYGYPSDFCAEMPATNEVLIINNGELPANDVFLDFRLGFLDVFSGMAPGTFEYNAGQGWTPITPSLTSPITLGACNKEAYSRSAITIPEVLPNDTVLVRYKVWHCFPNCDKDLIPPYLFTFYRKACPADASVTDSIGFPLDTTQIDIQHGFEFDFEGCMLEGNSYELLWNAQSSRFLTDTSFYQVRLNLPRGIFWDSTCTPPVINGAPPVYSNAQMNPDSSSEIVLTFQLPFSSDTISMPFCLRFICLPELPCQDIDGSINQNGGTATVFPPECPEACGLKVFTQGSIVNTVDEDGNCGLSSCYDFILFANADCPGNGGGGGGGGGGAIAGAFIDYKTYRTNYGVLDADDNRIADTNAPADSTQIRLDRYIPGDTLRFALKGVVILGSIGNISLKIFTESLESDFGLNDGDAYGLGGAANRFTHIDSIVLVRSAIRVKRTDGVIYTCEAPMMDYKNQNLIQVQEVNVQPPVTIDRFATMYRELFLGFQSCAPDNQPLATGDSLFLEYDYTFTQNFAPPAQGGLPPALINFRNVPWISGADYAWTIPDSFGFPRPMSQYSGYTLSRTFSRHTIRPCTTSLQQNPFQYGIRLARGNMFPYEVRQIAEVSDYQYYLPENVEINAVTADLILQEGVDWISDQPVNWDRTGTNVQLDFQADVFANLIDEGFNLITDIVYDPSCAFNGPDTTNTTYDITYPVGFPDNTVISYNRKDATGYLDALPQLVPDFSQTNLNLSAFNFEVDFVLKNVRPAQASNAWLYVEPLNGNLTDVELIRLPQGVQQPGLANLFQLGTVNLLENIPFRLKGVNTNCDALKVRMIFGWDCSPVTSPFTSTCGKDTVLLDLRLRNAVLELDVITQPDEVPLCEPSDYFVFEISNANDGNAYALTASVKLPEGLNIVNGSAQILYPSPGGAWVSIPDPQVATGNIYLWNMVDILPMLSNGLPGFNLSPANTFQIRFRTIAECGFVANAQPVYGVTGVQPCGTFTNSLRKPDEPIGLEGVNPAYDVDISISPASNDPVSCGAETELTIQMLLQGTPAAGDSIYITLPLGVSFVAGSYSAVQNAPSGPPQQFGQTLQLPITAGLGSGSVIKFNIKVKYDETAGCLDKFISAQTRQKINGFCATINQSCGVYLATGEALLQLPTANPDLKLSGFNVTGNAAGGGFNFEAGIENPGTVNAAGAVLQLWLDQNGNGIPDATDQLLQTLNYNQPIPSGANAVQNGTLNIPLADLCKLLAVLPAEENCACGPKFFPIQGNVVAVQDVARCSVEPVTIGVDSIAGHTYNWQPPGLLSCNDCSQATFNPGPDVQNTDVFTFVLFETSGTCTLEHRFNVRYGEPLGITSSDLTVCKGDTIRIDATPGGTYQWSGPGVNPTAQFQLVAPVTATTYTVTVTLADGCTGTDMVTVDILESSNTDLGILKTCPGTPVTIFDEPRTEAGEYCKIFTKANGCDSTVCITLQVVPVAGASVATICEGDSTEVFPNQFEQTAGEYCKTFINSAGCDSVHCVTLSVAPPITLNPVDSVILIIGDTVQLNGPAGFAEYNWTPAEGLSCTDCQSPLAAPDSTINYLLRVRNDAGCEDSLVYRVVVYPPCFEQIKIPNAFTPDGDGTNDVFRVVPFEGLEKVVGLQVYNRWGQKIYESATNPSWDGTVEGKPAPIDVYIFIIDVECNGETRRLPQREVSLLR